MHVNQVDGFEPLSIADAADATGGSWFSIFTDAFKDVLFDAFVTPETVSPDSYRDYDPIEDDPDHGCREDYFDDPGCGL